MIATQVIENLHYRLAQYYLNKLRVAEATYNQGHEHSNHALVLFDYDWPHIQQWQAWSVAYANTDDQIATLCKEYSLAGIELLILRQHPQERLEWLEAGLAASRQLGDTRAEMVHLYLLSKVYHVVGSLSIAQDYSEEALAWAQEQDNPLYTSKILITLGNIFYSKAMYEHAQSAFEQALVLGKQLDAKLEIGMALNALGSIAFAQNNYAPARDYLVQSLKIFEMYGHPHHVCMVLDDLSNLTLHIGDEEATAMYAERCVVQARIIGDQRHLALSLGVLGNLAKTQGEFAKAHRYFQESLEISQLLGRLSLEYLALSRLGTLFLRLGDLSAAFECFESALALSNKAGLRWYSAFTLMVMARVFRLWGDLQHGELKLREGLEIVAIIKSVTLQTLYLLEFAWLWHDRGQIEQSAKWTALLQANIKELDVEDLEVFDELKQKLQGELGQDRYAIAVEDGKTFDLESVLQEISREL